MADPIPQTDEQFAAASRILAGTFIDRFTRMGMEPDEIANLCVAALGEITASQIGPVGAVERLRITADIIESQCLAGVDPTVN